MGYEIYQRETVRVSTPAITLNARGRLVFNVAATKLLHDAGVDNVFLMWDGERRRFAVRATAKKDSRTVRVRYSANSKWAAISAKGFLELIGHDPAKTISYPAIWNEGESMLEVSLSGQEELPIEAPTREEPKRKAQLRAPMARQVAR
jgi:hypothetical protein